MRIFHFLLAIAACAGGAWAQEAPAQPAPPEPPRLPAVEEAIPAEEGEAASNEDVYTVHWLDETTSDTVALAAAVTPEIANQYLRPLARRLNEWPEIRWDVEPTKEYFKDLDRRVKRLREIMEPEAFFAAAGEAATRVAIYNGDWRRLDEALRVARDDDGNPLPPEFTDAVKAQAPELYLLIQVRLQRSHPVFVELVDRFLAKYPDAPFRNELKVAKLENLHKVPRGGSDYWDLADELMKDLPKGDLRNRTAYDRIVKHAMERNTGQMGVECEEFLLADPDSDYRPLVLSEWLGVSYLQADWATLERVAARVEKEYEAPTRENWIGGYYRAIAVWHLEQNPAKSYAMFRRLSLAPTSTPDPHHKIQVWAAYFAVLAAQRMPDAPARVGEMYEVVKDFPDSDFKCYIVYEFHGRFQAQQRAGF